MNTEHRSFPALAAFVVCASTVACGGEAPVDDIPLETDVSRSGVFQGFIDYGDANRNAAVQIGSCSGTLIAPDIVISVAHCFPNVPWWEDDPAAGVGKWRAMQPVVVRVGPNPASPVFTTTARWKNAAGFDDVGMYLLDTPVPANIARPAKVVNESEFDRLGGMNGKIMYQSGYGTECSGPNSPRTYAYVQDAGGMPRGVNTFTGQILNWGEPQAYIERNDSGSSLLWWNGAEARMYVFGVAQGWGGGSSCTAPQRTQPHYLGLFRTGAGDPTKPNISAWVTAAVNQSGFRNRFAPGGVPDRWHDFFCVGNETCGVGDFDGDGRDDIVTFTLGSTGDVYVGKSYGYRTGSSFGGVSQPGRGFESSMWHSSFGYGQENVGVIDIDGDGRDDIFAGSSWHLWITRSNGSGFGASYIASSNAPCRPGVERCTAGQIVGGGGEDLLAIHGSSGALTVYRSNGTGVEPSTFSTSLVTGQCGAPRMCELGDYDGDGDDDLIIAYHDGNGHVDVAINSGARFEAPQRWVNNACYRLWGFNRTCTLGDVDGDDLVDLVIQDEYFEEVHVVHNGATVVERQWSGAVCGAGHVCLSADFNGDGFDDLVDFARSSAPSTQGDVFVQTSLDTY